VSPRSDLLHQGILVQCLEKLHSRQEVSAPTAHLLLAEKCGLLRGRRHICSCAAFV